MKVIEEMQKRGYQPNPLWEDPAYRGKNRPICYPSNTLSEELTNPIYPEHNTIYLQECLQNLKDKGIHI